MWEIDLVWLNRIGIILNFIAGFLLAPDLIGRTRLRKLEAALERFIIKQRQFLSNFYEKREDPGYTGTVILALLCPVLSAGFWSLIWYSMLRDNVFTYRTLWIVTLIVLVPSIITIALRLDWIPLGFVDRCPDFVNSIVAVLILVIISGTVWVILGFGTGIYLLLTYILPKELGRSLGYLVSRMEGEDNVTSLLLVLGIAFFILGNLLQLLATIKESGK